MRKAISYAFLGKRLAKDYPEIFSEWVNDIEGLRAATAPLSTFPDAFENFCAITGHYFTQQDSRCTMETADHRKLFIVVALVMFDPVWMHYYKGRSTDRLCAMLSESLHCNDKWISQSVNNLRWEYYNLSTFRMQVDMIVYCIRNGLQCAAA